LSNFPDYDISRFFEQTNKFIKEAEKSGGKVFVHCISGISRSTAVICGYLIIEKQMKPKGNQIST
jgi:protein-tyrosine phosphatase